MLRKRSWRFSSSVTINFFTSYMDLYGNNFMESNYWGGRILFPSSVWVYTSTNTCTHTKQKEYLFSERYLRIKLTGLSILIYVDNGKSQGGKSALKNIWVGLESRLTLNPIEQNEDQHDVDDIV